ncbi:MAG TPA: DNA polymerase III subunit delta' [Ktedonobacterales bacterium]|nr:DNA polymerase III subunit delta' [Ktedonobacterales bacterium]
MTKVLGHQQARARLARAVASQQVSHAYLFTGPESIGKTTLALDFAKLLLCEHPDLAAGAPCGICASCRKVEHGNHPDVTLVAPEEGKRQLGVDIVRESVMRLANLAPSAGPWRVFVLPDVERMTLSTVNALLKTLEEPPPSVVLLLTSAEPENLLPTLLSRCQVIPLQPLAPHEVAAALEEGWHASPAEARELAALANGRLGWAVRALEKPELREERARHLEQIVTLASATRDARLKAAAGFAADGDTARRVLELWTLWWRDVTLAACSAMHLTSTGAARREAERQGKALGCPRADTFLRKLLEARAALDANANPRLALEVLLLDLPRIPS